MKRLLVLVAGCASSPPPAQPVTAQPAPPPPAQQAPAVEPEQPAPVATVTEDDAVAAGTSSLAAGPQVAIGDPKSAGDLDKAVIRRYVRRNIQKIRACYEAELANVPKLAGTLTVQFVIGRDGKVISANPSGLGNWNVENCVAEVIQKIEFPKPRGGGSIQVSYPFTFRPS